jgi:adenosylhomocysteine nucleosidase
VLLLVAAEALEFSGLLVRCPGSKVLKWPVRYARVAELGGRRLLMVANGPGPRLVEEALAVVADKVKVDKVVSTGFCGALDPSLRVGDIVLGSRLDASDGGRRFSARIPESDRPCRAGEVVSTDRVVETAAEKRALHGGGAVAVEMEAAAVAAWAEEHDRPFFCVRVVMDRADESFTLDFNAARDAGGRFSRWKILAGALRRPVDGLPELFRMARRSRFAARRLGEFLADCRF